KPAEGPGRRNRISGEPHRRLTAPLPHKWGRPIGSWEAPPHSWGGAGEAGGGAGPQESDISGSPIGAWRRLFPIKGEDPSGAARLLPIHGEVPAKPAEGPGRTNR